VEERWREMAGIEMEGEEAGRRKRGGERGCDDVLLSPEVPWLFKSEMERDLEGCTW